MQQIALIPHQGVAPRTALLPERLVTKVVVRVLPVVAASAIIGCLAVQYHFGHESSARLVDVRSGPASAQMVQLIHDEHAAVMDYVKAQTAAQQASNAAADEEDAEAVADAKLAATADAKLAAAAETKVAAADAAPSPAPVAVAESTPVAPHAKVRSPVIVSTPLPPQAPLAIAQVQHDSSAAPVAAAPVVAGPAAAAPIVATPVIAAAPATPPSLLARTVYATLHAVSTIGGIPNWIAGVGGHIGGSVPDTTGDARLMSRSS